MTNKKNKAKSPHGLGSLTSEAQIELHCIETVKLWSPSKGSKTASVGRFLRAVSTLEHAARHDDPYADHALLELEKAMNETLELCESTFNRLPSLVTSRVRLQEAASSKPLIKVLRIGSRFGWRLVSLIEKYDVLMVRLMDAEFKAQITRAVFERYRNECQRAMRNVLNQALALNHSGVTRQDMLTNNAKARTAIEKLGALPLEVLEGLERAEYAPVIVVKHD